MTTTPNMGLILPDDHGSPEVWGALLNAIFARVDAHTHLPGLGVLVGAAALNINADVSWASGGTSHAITDLTGLDFKPGPVPAALAGAFFISDGTSGLSANELYYRTTSGSNVKFTSGAALNVAAFTGGIGGDYGAVGALELYDDATDSYWFQQQVGAAVRQYARMRSADVDLYEFKANPAAGVPTNRVRLKSPAALAASYDITLPAALPAANRKFMMLDSAGLVTASADPVLFSFADALITTGSTAVPNIDNITIGNPGNVICPLRLSAGQSFTTWGVSLFKASVGSTTITVSLRDINLATGVASFVNSQATSATGPVAITIGNSGLTPASGHSYHLAIVISGLGGGGDLLLGWQVNP